MKLFKGICFTLAYPIEQDLNQASSYPGNYMKICIRRYCSKQKDQTRLLDHKYSREGQTGGKTG